MAFFFNALFLNLSFSTDFKMKYKNIRPIFKAWNLFFLNIVPTSNLFLNY